MKPHVCTLTDRKRIALKFLLGFAGLVVLGVAPASAATFTVTNTSDSGPGSLRQAITDANLFPGLDTIAFNIPGAGVHTIQGPGFLPGITDSVNIDGYTQPGSSPNTLPNGNNAVLLIELKGGVETLSLLAGGCTVRGLAIIESDWGIFIRHGNGNTIEGNFIGIHAIGAPWNPNFAFPGRVGIQVNSSYNMIGGVTPAARNVISGWTWAWGDGFSFHDGGGIMIGSFSVGNVIQGNFIGTDPSGLITNSSEFGSDPIFGNSNGIVIAGHYNVVGGTVPEARNVIAGNVIGVAVFGSAGIPSQGNKIQGNAIGTDITGRTALPNYLYGVTVQNAGENIIGGTESGTGNVIAYNGSAYEKLGVIFNGITAGVAVGPHIARIRGNSIFANGFMQNTGTTLGIDLANDGVTPNSDGDPLVGITPNEIVVISWQNYPVLNSVTVSGGTTTIQGTLNSRERNSYELDFFANSAADPSGYGEGEFFLGARTVTTDDNGNVSFSVGFPIEIPGGYFISATATGTDATGHTSEFSRVIEVPQGIPTLGIDDVAAPEGYDDARTEFTFTVRLSGPSSQSVTVTCATADGTAKSNSDYFPVPPATLTFAPGETSKTVTVVVKGDGNSESDETFFVNLSDATNATIADGQGVGTILNDD